MSSSTSLLNRLLRIHLRSLPSYLAEVGLWRGKIALDEELDRALKTIAFDHQATARRVAELILSRHEPLDYGQFPMEFTDKNDLAVEYLVREALEGQRRDQTAIEAVLFALPTHDAEAREVAQEALGAAKAHVDTLESLAAKQPA
jgi:hypothetical protein